MEANNNMGKRNMSLPSGSVDAWSGGDAGKGTVGEKPLPAGSVDAWKGGNVGKGMSYPNKITVSTPKYYG